VEGVGLSMFVSLASHGRCRFARGDDSGGGESDSDERFERGDVGRGIVRGAGEGDDAKGVEAEDEGR